MFTPVEYSRATHPHFDDVIALCLAFTSMSVAMSAFKTKTLKDVENQDAGIHVGGTVTRFSFRIHALMHLLAQRNWPDKMVFLWSSSAVPIEYHEDRELREPQIERLIGQLTGAAFLKFYESRVADWKRAMGDQPQQWDDLWRFAWIIRNAIGHGDVFKIKDKTICPCA